MAKFLTEIKLVLVVFISRAVKHPPYWRGGKKGYAGDYAGKADYYSNGGVNIAEEYQKDTGAYQKYWYLKLDHCFDLFNWFYQNYNSPGLKFQGGIALCVAMAGNKSERISSNKTVLLKFLRFMLKYDATVIQLWRKIALGMGGVIW